MQDTARVRMVSKENRQQTRQHFMLQGVPWWLQYKNYVESLILTKTCHVNLGSTHTKYFKQSFNKIHLQLVTNPSRAYRGSAVLGT